MEELRREAERRRTMSDDRAAVLDAILTASPHGIIVTDADGKVVVQNRASERIWRGSATAETLAGWSEYRTFDADGRPRETSKRAIARALAKGEAVEPEEADIERFDGTRGVLLGSAAPIRNADGTVTGAVSVFADITPFKDVERHAMERLEAQQRWLETIFDRIPSPLLIVEAGTARVLFANAAANRLAGQSLVHLSLDANPPRLTNRDGDPLPLDEYPAVRAARGETLDGHEFDWHSQDSVHSLLAYSAALPPMHGNPAAAVIHFIDVTARRRAEREQELLADVGNVLVSRLDFHAAVPDVARRVLARFAEVCAIDFVDERGEAETLALAHRDARKEPLLEGVPDLFAGARVLDRTTAGAFLVRDVDEEFLGALPVEETQRDRIRQLGIGSLVVVPLFAAGKVLGSFGVARTRGQIPFDERDARLVEGIAQRITIAADNSMLFGTAQQANRRLMALQEVTEAALSLRSAEAISRAACAGVRLAFGADTTSILLAEGDSRFRIVATDGLAAGFEGEVEIPVSRGAAGEALRTGAMQIVDDAQQVDVARPYLHSAGIKSLLVAPLRIDRQTLGVLQVGTRQPRHYSDDDLRLLQLIADRVAIGIEHHRLLESERSARADAEAANRMKDEFLATMSHELRTPLNAIVGWTALMRTASGDPRLVSKALDTIQRNAKSQARLIEDLLDVSRIISGKLNLVLGDTDLRAVVLAAIDAVRPAADSKVIALRETLEPIDGMFADGDRLQQIVWNLVSNAVKFTPKGGAVEVRLERAGSDVTITVADTGEGIPTDVLPFVFERFRQADSSLTRRHGGLGLGLAIVRHLVELHGGAVAAESTGPGAGSKFIVTLPVRVARLVTTAPAQPADETTRDAPTLALLRGVKVLAVDDDADARELLATLLARAGADVTTAASSRAAIEIVPSVRPDVIVCDIGMPDEDGYTFVRRLRQLEIERGGSIPAIALTAYARVDDARAALEAGFQQHVAKPVDPAHIIGSVAEVVRYARNAAS
jgi:PAS domain S-box-containing protein